MRIGEVELYSELVGDGPPLVLLHGGPGLSLETFKPTLERAGEFASVIFYDQRGCGRSAPLAAGTSCTVENMVADLEGLRAALGLERMALLGHSWGAYLALCYAVAHEQRLDKLILVCPLFPHPEPEAQIHGWWEQLAPAMRSEIQRITMSGLPPDEKATRRMEAMLPLYFHNLVAMEEFHRRGFRVAGKVSEMLAADIARRDLRAELARLRLPATIIAGRHDRRIPLHYVEENAAALYDARLAVLDASGHFPFLEQPEKFLEILRTEMVES